MTNDNQLFHPHGWLGRGPLLELLEYLKPVHDIFL